MDIFKNTYSAPKSISDVCRLKKYGNTCYLNSVIQAFYHSKLADKVLEINFSQNCKNIDQMSQV
jgi:uncharacterized UBP type Zn finger protein